ncbi:UBP1-associated protein 2B-like [Zingiber officinale]|uniref:UBP1-associated protein 2B-like n=1 Tax=Zingiber officinale TaxID=94328 RepID=UPI001C4B8BE0|nr:UBP1-associated protein 2B-like [Zingiber officinale]
MGRRGKRRVNRRAQPAPLHPLLSASMATKKRKVDQDDEILLPPDANSQAHHHPVVYTPAPPSDDEHGGEEEDDVSKLLELLSREHLVSLLVTAAASDPTTLSEIRRVADLDPAHRKIFVHGLGWETTKEGLRAAFSGYGDIDDCRVIFDKANGRGKGYGFVLFRHCSSACRALRRSQKLIDDRMISCQLATAGLSAHPAHHNNPGPSAGHQDNLSRKIYVGNVHPGINGAHLLSFFSQYGEIEEGPIGFDRRTGKPKGFALFVYKTAEGAMRALEEPRKYFEGHLLHCERAFDNKNKAASNQNAAASPNMAPSTGVLNVSGYASTPTDMALQQAAIMGQGLLSMCGAQALGQGIQSNPSILALLAAAGQNPAAFGVTPAMLATMNPAFVAAFGASGNQLSVPSAVVPQVKQVLNYGMGSTPYQGPPGFQLSTGFQGATGFQSSPSLQGPSDFQGIQEVAQRGGSSSSYLGVPMSRTMTGPMA